MQRSGGRNTCWGLDDSFEGYLDMLIILQHSRISHALPASHARFVADGHICSITHPLPTSPQEAGPHLRLAGRRVVGDILAHGHALQHGGRLQRRAQRGGLRLGWEPAPQAPG